MLLLYSDTFIVKLPHNLYIIIQNNTKTYCTQPAFKTAISCAISIQLNKGGFVISPPNFVLWCHNDFRTTEHSAKYFLLQHRKGHGGLKSLSSLIVGTMDSIFDTKPPPYRILHTTPSSEVSYGTILSFSYLFFITYLHHNS